MAKAVYTTGDFGCTVAVVKREGSRNWYLRVWDPAKRQPIYKPTKGRDLERAKGMARALSRRLEDGVSAARHGGPTLKCIFAAYGRDRTPEKCKRYQSEDRRRAVLWMRYLGAGTRVEQIKLEDWERFARDRPSGRIDARGETGRGETKSGGGPTHSKPPEPRSRQVRPRIDSQTSHSIADSAVPTLRPRAVRGDLMWLRTVLRWTKAHGMIERNPCDDWPLPEDPNPRRPVATENRLEAILKVVRADRMVPAATAAAGSIPAGERGSNPQSARFGYLYELLTLCAETGRRIGAVRKLRYSDLHLQAGPHGSIHWPAKTDKGRKESVVPLSAQARAAVDRVVLTRPGIGSAPLFPHPLKPGEPITHWYSRRWLEEAEKEAGLPKQDGSLWHAYRRKWATERKHLPAQDVAAAGGWTGIDTLTRIYQQPDASTLLRVVNEPFRLREAK